ncbi:MAG: hypothetical protein C0618_10965 [Desulfuromonas sp.]|nr:MAG: hypothetical protein C0618_10965 [Desulfuromonas sp.]
MSSLFLLLLIFFGGVAAAVQPVINARLAARVGVIEAATVSFGVGTVLLVGLSLLVSKGSFRGLVGTPAWEMSGGLFGAFFVALTILAVPRLGVTTVMAALIVAQLVTGLFFDHFGFLGVPVEAIDFKRIFGVLLLLVGTALVYRP